MRSQIEAAAAVLVALGVHAAFILAVEPRGGAQSSGQGGDAQVAIEAAPPGLSDLVAEWEKVPEAIGDPAPESAPPPVAEAPAQPAPRPELAPQVERPAFDMPAAPQVPSVPVAELPPPPPTEPALKPGAAPAPHPAIRPTPRPPVRETAEPASKPQATPPRPAGAGQRAAGSGGGAVAGDAQHSDTASRDAARQEDLRVSWGSAIRARIERHKRRPQSAGNASGTAVVRLTVTRSGQLAGIALQQSSGNTALDQAALAAVQSVGRFPAAPAGLSAASATFDLPINFAM